MGGGPDNFHTAVIGLGIRLAAHEGRQEGVMDVDDSALVMLDKRRGNNLHVAGQHNAIRLGLR
ncbi:hypothetical protein D3C76_1716610 [compost metagenome]